jgi:hypothetical protein
MIPIVKVLKKFGRRNVCPTQPLPKLFLFTMTTILKSTIYPIHYQLSVP